MIDRGRGEAVVAAARARAAQSPNGRLPAAQMTEWDIFPFEGELLVRALDDVTLPEPPRAGVDGVDCHSCGVTAEDALWWGDRWHVTAPAEPPPVVQLLLHPNRHVDLAGLTREESAELGVLTVQVARIVEALPGIGRAHVYRIGDGAEHLHIWFFGRPAGVLQLRGSTLVDWADLLPPMSAEQWAADRAAIAAALEARP